MSRAKILVTSTFATSFILEDVRLLRKRYDVAHLVTSGLMSPPLIALAVRHADVAYSWFASTYAAAAVAAAKIFGKKSMIAIGGADVAGMKELGYGIWISPWKSRLSGYALRNADQVLAVDPALREAAIGLARYAGDNIDVLPTGYDASFWSPAGEKEPFVLTVAAVDSPAREKIKGLGYLFDAARRLASTPFRLVGIHPRIIDGLRRDAPPNMEIHPPLQQEKLRELYRRAAVYCQPSVFEGLPNAVCEAMLCGCFPVVTDAGGMRNAVADAGEVVPIGDTDRLVESLRRGLGASPGVRARGRESIASRFTVERREEGLNRAIEKLMQ